MIRITLCWPRYQYISWVSLIKLLLLINDFVILVLSWLVKYKIWALKQNHLRTTVKATHLCTFYVSLVAKMLLPCEWVSSEWQLTINAALVPFCGCRQIIMTVTRNTTETKVIIRIIHHSAITLACTPFVMATLRITANTTRNVEMKCRMHVSVKSF